MKKTISILLCAALLLAILAGCGTSQNGPSDAIQSSTGENTDERLPNLMVMSGPTGVGAAKLIADWTAGESVVASATVAIDNEEVKNALINGDVDIAAVATNVASALYNKTDGAIQVLAINTLGVLYILEKGDSIQTMADLEGKTVYATGQGANPEYILKYLLNKSGADAGKVDIQWMTAQEVIAKMSTEEASVCMLPVPAATTLLMKDPAVRQALSLSDIWSDVGDTMLAQGCIVGRTDYIQENPQALEAFLKAYEESLAYMTVEENKNDAAALVAQYGITANPQIAVNAIPNCNLTFITGAEMKSILESFYQVMLQANPASIGGAIPGDDFYYGS